MTDEDIGPWRYEVPVHPPLSPRRSLRPVRLKRRLRPSSLTTRQVIDTTTVFTPCSAKIVWGRMKGSTTNRATSCYQRQRREPCQLNLADIKKKLSKLSRSPRPQNSLLPSTLFAHYSSGCLLCESVQSTTSPKDIAVLVPAGRYRKQVPMEREKRELSISDCDYIASQWNDQITRSRLVTKRRKKRSMKQAKNTQKSEDFGEVLGSILRGGGLGGARTLYS